MRTINTAVVGVGNCFSSLFQGLGYYATQAEKSEGLCHPLIGGYAPADINIVAAFDIDQRKVGRDVAQAIFSPPNTTTVFYPDVAETNVIVRMSPVMDGVAAHMLKYDENQSFRVASDPEPNMDEVIETLRSQDTHVVINYLPVGAQRATEFYAECALQARAAFINCIPVFIASDRSWAERYEQAKLPLIGDDVKSQIGATIIHRTLTDLFRRRGAKLNRTYQLNTGGNTDFLNMLDRDRLASKKKSKTEAVQAMAATRLDENDIHVGPSDYVPWQRDNKVSFIRMEGELFGGVPMNLELRLSVEDSPNSAGVVIDAIRCAKLALDRRWGGVLHSVSACFCKHPPHQLDDVEAGRQLEIFIDGDG
jgi:myo-inositol-1-phosphate synthase